MSVGVLSLIFQRYLDVGFLLSLLHEVSKFGVSLGVFGICQQTQDDSLENTALSGPILTDDKVDVFVWGPGELSVTHEILYTDLLNNATDRGVLLFSNLKKLLKVNIGCLVILKFISLP